MEDFRTQEEMLDREVKIGRPEPSVVPPGEDVHREHAPQRRRPVGVQVQTQNRPLYGQGSDGREGFVSVLTHVPGATEHRIRQEV